MAEIEKDKSQLEYFIVSDPGNRVCHANLLIAFDRTNNMVYVLDEIYETEQTNTATSLLYPRILEKVQENFPNNSDPVHIYDEAALWFETEVMANFPNSFALTPTNKASKNKETSMGVIKNCMLKGKYKQSDRCVSLKEEIMSYYLDDKGRYPKDRDHAIDALRYFFDYVGYGYELTVANKTFIEDKDLPLLCRPARQAREDFFDEDSLWN